MSIELDLSDDGRHDLPSFWSSQIPSDATHIVVHMRNADDIQSLIAENNSLRDELQKAKQDIFTWTSYGAKYLECLDELRELRSFLKKNGLSWRFRNI